MDSSELEGILPVALKLGQQAARDRHRRLLLLEGAADWGRATAHAIAEALASAPTLWVGNSDDPCALAPSRATDLLGGECALLVIDTHGGLHPDALGAAVGTLRGGGLLLLLTPALDAWPALADPEAERFAVYPFGAADLNGRFVARLARLLVASPAVTRFTSHRPQLAMTEISAMRSESSQQPHRMPPAAPASARGVAASADQQQAIDAVCKVAEGRARRPLVLSSDRGRGKSAALGIAAARLLSMSERHIIVTAPRRAAAEAIFKHARAVDANATRQPRFIAPDTLLAEYPRADLLLVDEAAGIPAPLLESMLSRYARIVFATTVHGYEGTGRGFELRFREVLDRVTPGWRALRLSTPIRWAANDPLESLINQILLLDAEPASDHAFTRLAVCCDPMLPSFEVLEPDVLIADEPLLRQIFGLFVLGHYQTRPSDLRHLLDGLNLSLCILRLNDVVLAAALTAHEGPLPEALLEPIFGGLRRPRGHLLPQTLSAHAGLFDAPRHAYTRIVRIAVHGCVRSRGLGQRLVHALAHQARSEGRDLIGASFGATRQLLRFWRRCGLLPVQLGSHRNATSGAHAALVLRPLSLAGNQLFDQARAALPRRLNVLLSGPLRQVEPAVIAELLYDCPHAGAPLDANEIRGLIAFSQASANLHTALPALHRLTRLALPRALARGALTPEQIAALIAGVLQQREQAQISALLASQGKAQTLHLLRQATDRLLTVAGLLNKDSHPIG